VTALWRRMPLALRSRGPVGAGRIGTCRLARRLTEPLSRLPDLRYGDLNVRPTFALSFAVRSSAKTMLRRVGLLNTPDFRPGSARILDITVGDARGPNCSWINCR